MLQISKIYQVVRVNVLGGVNAEAREADADQIRQIVRNALAENTQNTRCRQYRDWREN